MKCGLIGEKLGHSFSPQIHKELADYSYDLFEMPESEVEAFLKSARFDCINVTIPYKKNVMPYLDEISDEALRIGAVNTVVKDKNGKLRGDNTDYYGFLYTVNQSNIEIKNKNILILGTGGTSNTAIAVCEALGARQTVVVGRSAKNGAISYSDLYRDHTDVDYIINTTPCGMYPYPDGNETIAATPVDLSAFPSLKGVTDAVYNPLRTNFIMDARERGIPAEGGLYMLVAQAVVAAEKFMGKSIDPSVTDRIFSEIQASKENIVLSGMPGSRKSTVGKYLAKTLNRKLIDTDAEIEARCGCTIKELRS